MDTKKIRHFCPRQSPDNAALKHVVAAAVCVCAFVVL